MPHVVYGYARVSSTDQKIDRQIVQLKSDGIEERNLSLIHIQMCIRDRHTPDVLLCLANLSNDEVFTPPDIANQVLDMLPQALFRDPTTKFLDPACKSGVFLRESAKRLIEGLEDKIQDLQQRVDHIFHEQLYGIAITELTSLLSRRSLYCSKYPNGPFSVSHFDDAVGKIRFKNTQHVWKDGRCLFCGVSKDTVLGDERRGSELEAHAYEWIHTCL